jgi:hypothetical protein
MGIEDTVQKLSSSGRTLVHFAEVIKEKTSDQNSPRRTPEVTGTVGSRIVVEWIRVG